MEEFYLELERERLVFQRDPEKHRNQGLGFRAGFAGQGFWLLFVQRRYHASKASSEVGVDELLGASCQDCLPPASLEAPPQSGVYAHATQHLKACKATKVLQKSNSSSSVKVILEVIVIQVIV